MTSEKIAEFTNIPAYAPNSDGRYQNTVSKNKDRS
jgi:hypothetical protein